MQNSQFQNGNNTTLSKRTLQCHSGCKTGKTIRDGDGLKKNKEHHPPNLDFVNKKGLWANHV